MAYVLPNTITNGDAFDATPVQGNFDSIENELNSIDGANIDAGTVPDTAMVNSPITVRDETLPDQVISGLTTADPGATRTAVIAGGTAYIQGNRVVVNADTRAYTASKDSYVDLDKNGVFHITEVSNGAGAPSMYSDSIRIAKIVTNATEVTSVTQSEIDSAGNVIYPVMYSTPTTKWKSWTMTATGLDTTKATVVSKYQQINKTVNFFVEATLTSSTSPVVGAIKISLPVTSTTRQNWEPIGMATLRDANGGSQAGALMWETTGTGNLMLLDATSNFYGVCSATAPFTWASGDQILISGSYEAA